LLPKQKILQPSGIRGVISVMNERDQPQNSPPSPDEGLDRLFAQAPLREPSDWFVTQTLSLIRRESAQTEYRWLRWIWTSAGALALLLLWTGIEIHQQSQNEILSIASLEVNNWSDGNGNEDSWPGQ
jgi:hypothetical protein